MLQLSEKMCQEIMNRASNIISWDLVRTIIEFMGIMDLRYLDGVHPEFTREIFLSGKKILYYTSDPIFINCGDDEVLIDDRQFSNIADDTLVIRTESGQVFGLHNIDRWYSFDRILSPVSKTNIGEYIDNNKIYECDVTKKFIGTDDIHNGPVCWPTSIDINRELVLGWSKGSDETFLETFKVIFRDGRWV